jgi:hypothetical protein
MRLHPTGKFDNQAARYQWIQAKPLAAALGAEICGVDIPKLTDAQAEEIRHALFRHKMIFFRGQKLSHESHEAFSLRFGPFAEDAYTQGVPGHRNVHPLIKEADDPSKHGVRRRLAHRLAVPARAAGDHLAAFGGNSALRWRHYVREFGARL